MRPRVGARVMRSVGGPLPDNRAVAVAYCEAGFAVIPLLPRTKKPAIPSLHPKVERGRCRGECGQLGHGYHDARSDPEWAYRLWSLRPEWGIGARPTPDQFVVDVDPRNGGDATLDRLQQVHGELPETFTVITGRGDGGRHRWFRCAPNRIVKRLGDGIDVISHGTGMVVMPPSLHPETGLAYRVETPGVGTTVAPSWLAELVTRPEPKVLSPRRRRRRLSPMEVRRQGRGLIASIANAPDGQRHNTLYWATRRAAEQGLFDVPDCFEVALVEAAQESGLPRDEIESVIGDAIAAATPMRWSLS